MTIKEAIRRIRNYIGFLYGTKEAQEDICEALNMAITALREQEENRWIPVTERLPEEKEIVLARLPHPVQRLNAPYYEDVLLLWRVKHNIIGGHSYIAWERVYGGETVSYNPTHWMRLPAPPKEETP